MTNYKDSVATLLIIACVCLICVHMKWFSLHWSVSPTQENYSVDNNARSSVNVDNNARLAGNVVSNATPEACVENTVSVHKNTGKTLKEISDEVSGPGVRATDPRLVDVVRRHVIEERRPYMFKNSHALINSPQSEHVMKLFNDKRGGFFVECGGLDGERGSNTVMLERKLRWTGLLIEADPSYYLQLRGKNRQCHTANCCLSPEPYPYSTVFKTHGQGQGKLHVADDKKERPRDINYIDTWCVPLQTLLLALNRTRVDYFSLDVEGFEVPILRAIPWAELDIGVLSVEYMHGNRSEYVEVMTQAGYTLNATIELFNRDVWAADYIFVKNGWFS